MVVLQTVQNGSALFSSGLMATIISGIVAFIGYLINARIQSSNNDKTINTQKEIAKMQNDEKLFYEKQIEWANETRKLIAKFVTDCIELNRYIKIAHNLGEETYKGKELQKYVEKADKMSERVEELTLNLQEETTLIRPTFSTRKTTMKRWFATRCWPLNNTFLKGKQFPTLS